MKTPQKVEQLTVMNADLYKIHDLPNIPQELTDLVTQYMMLYGIIAEHNPKDANPDFDVQTFDNLFQAICNAKETYL